MLSTQKAFQCIVTLQMCYAQQHKHAVRASTGSIRTARCLGMIRNDTKLSSMPLCLAGNQTSALAICQQTDHCLENPATNP